MPDFNAPNALPEFATAARAAATPQAIVSMQLDADVLDWFRNNQPDGMNWQQDMNSVLRSYMGSIQALEASAPSESSPDGPERHEADNARDQAMWEMIQRHQAEYEDVHNGSGRSEEMPSDLDSRHREEWRAFEDAWPDPEATPASASLPASKPPSFTPG